MSTRDFLAVLGRERPGVKDALGQLVQALAQTPHLAPAQRELVRLAVAVALGNTEAVAGHLSMARNVGVTRDQLVDAILLCIPGAGAPRALAALSLLVDLDQPQG